MPIFDVAGLNLDIEYIDNALLQNRLLKYRTDRSSRTFCPDMFLKTTCVDKIEEPIGELISIIKDTKTLRTEDGRYCRCMFDDTGTLISMIKYESDYSNIGIQLTSDIEKTGYLLGNYEYYYTGFAFSDRLLVKGGAVMHGSAIALGGHGLIFSANSGTGKSTQSVLWKAYFGDRVAIVNDDKPAMRFVDSLPWLYGTPWSGKTDLNDNVSIPLSAVIFLDRADINSMERLGTRDSIFRLMSQISRPYYDEDLGLKTVRVIENIVRTTPVYLLHCNISYNAVETAYNKLIEEGVLNP